MQDSTFMGIMGTIGDMNFTRCANAYFIRPMSLISPISLKTNVVSMTQTG